MPLMILKNTKSPGNDGFIFLNLFSYTLAKRKKKKAIIKCSSAYSPKYFKSFYDLDFTTNTCAYDTISFKPSIK